MQSKAGTVHKKDRLLFGKWSFYFPPMQKLGKQGYLTGFVFFFLVLLLYSIPLSAEEKVALSTNGVEIKFSALTQIWGTTSFGKEQTFGSDPITFKLRRSELRFSGKIEGDKINWSVMFDPAAHPTNLLQDLYINLNYIPKTEFRVGQFKIPLSMEQLISPAQIDFVERALVVRTFSDRRDIGAMVSSKFTKLEYYAGVFNGSGQNKTDNNNFKDLASRIVIKPASSFHIGASGYWGKKAVIDYYNYPPNKSFNLDSFRVAGELKVDYYNLGLRAEVIWAADEYASISFPSANRRPFFSYKWGGYTSLLYKLMDSHQVGLRGEWFNPHIGGGRNESFITTIGYNFFFTPRAKWQINLQSQVYRRGNIENLDIYFVLTNLQISF